MRIRFSVSTEVDTEKDAHELYEWAIDQLSDTLDVDALWIKKNGIWEEQSGK